MFLGSLEKMLLATSRFDTIMLHTTYTLGEIQELMLTVL